MLLRDKERCRCAQHEHRLLNCLNGSVLDAFKCSRIMDGCCASLTEISAKQKWAEGSKQEGDGTVISPDQRNPKKHVREAAQSITLSNEGL